MHAKQVVFSGIQPSGNLHLGNYLGAIEQFKKLQQDHRCFFSIVDLHAITVPYDREALAKHTRNTAAMYVAAGIDPQRVNVFVQSAVPEHTEMAWLLSCFTSIGHLNRMVQFKQKSASNREKSSLGLYSYPCLMAADILLYQTDLVPVGEDQTQHLELTINIAKHINYLHGDDVLRVPEPLLNEHTSRIMSLRNPTQKMSKTDVSDYTRINLNDDNDAIRLKIKKATTDPHPFAQDWQELSTRPEINNLFNIYRGLSPEESKEALLRQFAGVPLAKFKTALTDLMVAKLEPIRTKYHQILAEPDYLDKILSEGRAEAQNTAQTTIAKLKQHLGLYL